MPNLNFAQLASFVPPPLAIKPSNNILPFEAKLSEIPQSENSVASSPLDVPIPDIRWQELAQFVPPSVAVGPEPIERMGLQSGEAVDATGDIANEALLASTLGPAKGAAYLATRLLDEPFKASVEERQKQAELDNPELMGTTAGQLPYELQKKLTDVVQLALFIPKAPKVPEPIPSKYETLTSQTSSDAPGISATAPTKALTQDALIPGNIQSVEGGVPSSVLRKQLLGGETGGIGKNPETIGTTGSEIPKNLLPGNIAIEGEGFSMSPSPRRVFSPEVQIKRENEAIKRRLAEVEKNDKMKLVKSEAIEKTKAIYDRKIANIKTDKEILARRRSTIAAVKQQFDLSDDDLKSITKKDIRLMDDFEFHTFLDDVRVKSEEIADWNQAKNELVYTISEKELIKYDNVRQAMKLPKIEDMDIKQLNQLNEVLSQYKTGDEFLPVRQLETINKTELTGNRTTREVREHLASKYNMTPEAMPGIKPHPFMGDYQLSLEHPFYDLMIQKHNMADMEASSRVKELVDMNDHFVKQARSSTSEGMLSNIVEHIAPVDKKISKWLEANENEKLSLAENMTKEELNAAEFQRSIYKEYYDSFVKDAVENKFSSRFVDNYFPHARRPFFESWEEDGVVKAFKESFDKFKQEEKLATILDSKTGDILPFEKWVGFKQFRTGELVPSKNTARSFKMYVSALEKARQFDKYIPEIEIYVHSLSPKGLTARGVELDDSFKRFVKTWINSKKGRIEKQIVKPGGKLDWALRGGTTLVRIHDLGFNIPLGVANIFGEQAGNLTMMGSKNYSLGLARLATPKGIEITKQYENFVGKTFWDTLTEASNTAGDQLLAGMFGSFGFGSRKGNQVFLLGNMTPEEFESGKISLERLARLKTNMGEYRPTQGSESVFGKSIESAVMGQNKKWSIPILTATVRNANILAKNIRKDGVRALKSKEGAKLFYSVVLGSGVGLMLHGYLKEENKNRNKGFIENLIFKSVQDGLSMVGALNPSFIGSLSMPRLSSFIVDITKDISSVLFLERYKNGELKGVKELGRHLNPSIVKYLTSSETESERKRREYREYIENKRVQRR